MRGSENTRESCGQEPEKNHSLAVPRPFSETQAGDFFYVFHTDLLTLLALLYASVEVLGIATALRAILTTRTSQGAVAWAIALITFPWIALPLYGVFGGRRFRGYVAARRRGNARIQRLAADIVAALPQDAFGPHAELPARVRAAERLAEMPFLAHNRARLLINGEATFEAIFASIDAAREYLLIEFYILRDDGLGRALRDRLLVRLRQGLRVYILYDRIGSQGLSRRYVTSLVQAGAEVAPFVSTRNPLRRIQINFRNHRKIVVVDGEMAFVGGHNVGDEYLGRHPRLSPWRDTHVEIRGPAVLAVQLAFLEDWYWATERLPELHWQLCGDCSGTIPVLALPSGPADEMETCSLFFLHAIHSAQRRLWISSPYFVPDEAVVAALQLAVLRGVDVRILLPARADHWLVHLASFAYISEIRRWGVRLFRYQAGFLHQKAMLVDEVGMVGTANFDNRSFRLNFEITLVFAEAGFAGEIADMFARDFACCVEIADNDGARWPLLRHVASNAARLFAPVL